MTNYNTQFSFMLPIFAVCKDAVDLRARCSELSDLLDGAEKSGEDLGTSSVDISDLSDWYDDGDNIDLIPPHVFEAARRVIQSVDSLCGTDWEVQDDGIWIHSDGEGSADVAVTIAQAFLSVARDTRKFGFEYSHTASRPVLDGFGGGAVAFTAAEEEWHSTSSWLDLQGIKCSSK